MSSYKNIIDIKPNKLEYDYSKNKKLQPISIIYIIFQFENYIINILIQFYQSNSNKFEESCLSI